MTGLVKRLREIIADALPSTAENPNESAYQRGRFDGIIEYGTRLNEAADALSRAGAAEGWTCSECGQGAPERFRVFARCHICAANQSVRRLKATIDGLRHASQPAIQPAPSVVKAWQPKMDAVVERLTRLTIGSCSCGAKSPELRWHEEACGYRVAEEALLDLIAIQSALATPPQGEETEPVATGFMADMPRLQFATQFIAAGLHAKTADMVARFADALACKLRSAEVKYGYSIGWADDDWEAECKDALAHHVVKGDPLDVAAYAAFCWARGWSTVPAISLQSPSLPASALTALKEAVAALKGVIAVADRKTDEFDRAHVAVAKAEAALSLSGGAK